MRSEGTWKIDTFNIFKKYLFFGERSNVTLEYTVVWRGQRERKGNLGQTPC